jgi:hypothetical protein
MQLLNTGCGLILPLQSTRGDLQILVYGDSHLLRFGTGQLQDSGQQKLLKE